MVTDLSREIEVLRERLAVAEDMHRAITQGELDGFVVNRDGSTNVQLLAEAYTRDLTERNKRHQAADERTRKFLGMLAVELLNMLKGMRQSVDPLKRQELTASGRKLLETLEKQLRAMQHLAEDLHTLNPKD